jgi:hypothetical protein
VKLFLEGGQMQRREFIGGILWTTLFARLGFAEGLDKTLLALAQVIIPDREPAVWISSDVAEALVGEIEKLESPRKDQIAATLTTLNEAARRKERQDFHELSLQLRTALVKEQTDLSEEVTLGFAAVRAASIKCFYSSSIGHQRTGYRETDQFKGYPEYCQTAETWE